MTSEDALLAIQEILDGTEWDSDTTEAIAQIMVQAGYRIRDLDEKDHQWLDTSRLHEPSISTQPLTEALTGLKHQFVIPDEIQEHVQSSTDAALPAADAASGPLQDHERIWLEPRASDDYFGHDGRSWCQDKAWPEKEGEPEPTEYIRADLHQHVVNAVTGIGEENCKLKLQLNKAVTALKSLVSDIRGMTTQPAGDSDSAYWFGPFSEATDAMAEPDSDVCVEWPNLAISCEDAEKLLKELGCPSSNSSS